MPVRPPWNPCVYLSTLLFLVPLVKGREEPPRLPATIYGHHRPQDRRGGVRCRILPRRFRAEVVRHRCGLLRDGEKEGGRRRLISPRRGQGLRFRRDWEWDTVRLLSSSLPRLLALFRLVSFLCVYLAFLSILSPVGIFSFRRVEDDDPRFYTTHALVFGDKRIAFRYPPVIFSRALRTESVLFDHLLSCSKA